LPRAGSAQRGAAARRRGNVPNPPARLAPTHAAPIPLCTRYDQKPVRFVPVQWSERVQSQIVSGKRGDRPYSGGVGMMMAVSFERYGRLYYLDPGAYSPSIGDKVL